MSIFGWLVPGSRGHGPRPHVACDRGCAWASRPRFVSLLVVCVRRLMTTDPIGAPVLVAMDSLDALRIYISNLILFGTVIL